MAYPTISGQEMVPSPPRFPDYSGLGSAAWHEQSGPYGADMQRGGMPADPRGASEGGMPGDLGSAFAPSPRAGMRRTPRPQGRPQGPGERRMGGNLAAAFRPRARPMPPGRRPMPPREDPAGLPYFPGPDFPRNG